MNGVPQRWLGLVLRIARRHYPEARLAAWGPVVDHGLPPAPGVRLELTFLDPPDPDPALLTEMRNELDQSDITIKTDLRALADLTISEQEEVLQRGAQFGG